MNDDSHWNWRGGVLVTAVSLAAGALVWVAAPWLLGHSEPWDAPLEHYLACLGMAGLVAGAVAPRWFWLAWPALYAGQLTGALLTLSGSGPLVPFGLFFFMPAFSLAGLAGAAVGAVLRVAGRRVLRRTRTLRTPHL